MSETRYPYQPKIVTFLLVIAMFGSCASFFIYQAINNEVGLIINGLLELSQNGATIFYGVLAALSLGFVLIGLLSMFKRFTTKREIVVGDTSISSPKSGVSSKVITVAYADILMMERQEVSGQHILNITHNDGKLSIPHSMLPSKQVFEEMVDLITKKRASLGDNWEVKSPNK